MRYIRTKDTIFEVVEETELVFRVRAKGNTHNVYSKSKCATDVIRYSDTIEKLCDCFVGIYKDEEEIEDKEISYFLSNLANENYFKEIYGAIWTDKGLIYVARYVEGELVLL